MKLILATTNTGKLRELRTLVPAAIEVIGLQEAGLRAPNETGNTFADNALLKARAALAGAKVAIADDSGLEVDALDGAPGVRSARFAGEGASDDENNRLLLRELTAAAPERRTARFRSAVALTTADGFECVAEGTVEGRITMAARGQHGFGYDPVFEVTDPRAGAAAGRTLAELTTAEKNQISHRARAYAALLAALAEHDVTLEALLRRAASRTAAHD